MSRETVHLTKTTEVHVGPAGNGKYVVMVTPVKATAMNKREALALARALTKVAGELEADHE